MNSHPSPKEPFLNSSPIHSNSHSSSPSSPFTNPKTGFSTAAQEALTSSLPGKTDSDSSYAKTILNAATLAGELSAEDIQTSQERLDPLSSLNQEMQERVSDAFTIHEQLFSRIDQDIPTIVDFAKARPDIYTTLATAYDQMEQAGLEPTIVISSINLPQDQLVQLADNLTNDPSIPNNPLKAQSDGNGLWLSEWQSKYYEQLQDQARDYLESQDATIVTQDGIDYVIAVVPAGERPLIEKITIPKTDSSGNPVLDPSGNPTTEEVYKNYHDYVAGATGTQGITQGTANTQGATQGTANTQGITKGATCTPDQYYTLQLARVQQGLAPLDQGAYYTWLYGGGDGLDGISPRGSFYSIYGQVVANRDDSGYRHSNLGCRPPVWG
jgi:hypothetical protein